MDDEELPEDKTLEYDDETLELTLPSGDGTLVDLLAAGSLRILRDLKPF